MQTVSSRIWTLVSNSISYDDNCYAEHASLPLCHEQDVIQGQFLSGILLVLIQGFLSSRLVAWSKLENPLCPTLYWFCL